MLSNMVMVECLIGLVDVGGRLAPETLVGPVVIVVSKVRV